MEELKGEGEGFFGEIGKMNRELQREERRRIDKARYRWYREIKEEGIPGYLKKG